MITESYIPRSKIEPVQIHFIHDNGGRPFRAVISSLGLAVGSRTEKSGGRYVGYVLTLTSFDGIWIGHDPTSAQHGNSILVRERMHRYVYIGSEVYRFETIDEIVDYVSPVGNSDVPYPVAYGKKNVYFMLEKRVVPRDKLETPITVDGADDIYGEFYGHVGTRGPLEKISDRMQSVEMIAKRNT